MVACVSGCVRVLLALYMFGVFDVDGCVLVSGLYVLLVVFVLWVCYCSWAYIGYMVRVRYGYGLVLLVLCVSLDVCFLGVLWF